MSTRESRLRNIFNPFHNLKQKSPAAITMNAMKKYQNKIDLNLTTVTNKKHMKIINAEERKRIADDMQLKSRGISIRRLQNLNAFYGI